MTTSLDSSLDPISRVIKAPRSVIWKARTDPASFEQWVVHCHGATRRTRRATGVRGKVNACLRSAVSARTGVACPSLFPRVARWC